MTPRKRLPSAETRKDWSYSIALVSGITLLLLITLQKLHLISPATGGFSTEVGAGLTALKAKKTDVAKREFDALLAKSPDSAEAYLAILQVCQMTQQWELSYEYIQRALKTVGTKSDEIRSVLYSSLANTLVERKGENWRKEALHAAEQAYALTPKDLSTQNMYGYMLADLEDDPAQIEKAFGILRGTVEAAENRGSDINAQSFLSAVLDSYGWVLYKKGDAASAIITLQRAINALPQEAINLAADALPGQLGAQDLKVYYYHLGAACYKAKQYEEARRALQTALKYAPDYREAKSILDALPPPIKE